MRHLFISPSHVQSPRWREAFPEARWLASAEPAPETFTWLLLEDASALKQLSTWVERGYPVVAMTRLESADEARAAIAAGARGYVHYLAAASLLQQVAQVVSLGGVWIGPDLMQQLMLAARPAAPKAVGSQSLALLTPREQSVAQAVADGKTNKEVARELDITERTVKAHLGAIFEKLGVRDRLQLVLLLGGQS